MPEFRINTVLTTDCSYVVEAETEDEARALFESGLHGAEREHYDTEETIHSIERR